MVCWPLGVLLLATFSGTVQLVFAEEGSLPNSDDPLPDKIGVEVHLSSKERSALRKLECSMCQAIVREMHLEVSKHKMTRGGVGAEAKVWDTANAICLALLQKYRLTTAGPSLELKDEDEEEMYGGMKPGPGGPEAAMRDMIVLKMGCQQWVEDYGGDVPGYIFKIVREQLNSAEGAAQDYCVRHVHQCGEGKNEKKKKEREKELERQKKRSELEKLEAKREKKILEKDPTRSLPEESKFGLQRMLELAKDDPLYYMEEEEKQRLREARSQLRCPVCRLLIEEVYTELMTRPLSMRREYDMLPLLEGICEGGKDRSVPPYFGVEPPPLPPVWTDKWRPARAKSGRHELRPFPKKKRKEREKWRVLANDGKQRPPGGKETEDDMLLTMTCKEVADPAKMAEILYREAAACKGAEAMAKPCDPVLATARLVCTQPDGKGCEFHEEGRPSEPKTEL